MDEKEDYNSAYWQNASYQELWDEMKRNPASMNDLLPLFPVSVNILMTRKYIHKHIYLTKNKFNSRMNSRHNRVKI